MQPLRSTILDPSIDSSSIDILVDRARAAEFIKRLRTNAIMGPLPTLYLVWLVWDFAPRSQLIVWMITLIGLDLAAVVHGALFGVRRTASKVHRGWVVRQALLQSSAGFIWGLTAIWYQASPTAIFSISLVILTVYAISTMNLIHYGWPVLVHTMAVWLTPMVMLVRTGGELADQLAIGIVVLAISIGIYLFEVSRQLNDGLRQRFQSKALAEQVRASAMEIERMASFDELCGSLNRRRGMEALAHHMTNDVPTSVALVDADHFKDINDTYGHPAGDAVLRSLAAALDQGSRQTDIVARVGGEEFLIIMPQTGLSQAQIVCDRLIKQVAAQPVDCKDQPINITISIGVTEADPTEAGDDLLVRVDQALYLAKAMGRNRVQVSTEHTSSSLDPVS